jgi:hypothetical protein
MTLLCGGSPLKLSKRKCVECDCLVVQPLTATLNGRRVGRVYVCREHRREVENRIADWLGVTSWPRGFIGSRAA